MNLANSLKHSSGQGWPRKLGLLNDLEGAAACLFRKFSLLKKQQRKE